PRYQPARASRSERQPGLGQAGGHDRDRHEPRGGRVTRPTTPVDQDQPALAAALLDQEIDGDLRGIVRILGVLEIAQGTMAEDDADDRLAFARARHAAQRAVRVGAAADQRAVADAPRQLAGGAAGRRAGPDRAVAIERDRTYRAAARLDRLSGHLGVGLALAVGDERLRITFEDADGGREAQRHLPPQQQAVARPTA